MAVSDAFSFVFVTVVVKGLSYANMVVIVVCFWMVSLRKANRSLWPSIPFDRLRVSLSVRVAAGSGAVLHFLVAPRI